MDFWASERSQVRTLQASLHEKTLIFSVFSVFDLGCYWLAFQMIPYPFLDARNNSDSCKKFTDTPMWNSTLSERIGPMTAVDRSNPSYLYYSPVEAESFDGLPPAYIETAEFDCLHDDGILYAKKLREAGISVTLNETEGTMHGFDIMQKAPTTLKVLKERVSFMKKYFYQ